MTLRIGKRAALALMVTVGLLASAPAFALQCVPYAREASGIDLRGDAWRWWRAAEGVYERGHAPRPGAVMVFRKHGKMRLGHVAVVKRIVNAREVLIDHANWGTRNTGRGRVSKMVAMRDVSRHNDWSEVKVWNIATGDYGTRAYPTYGFIYPHGRFKAKDTPFSAELPEEVAAMMADADAEADADNQSASMPDTDSAPAYGLAAVLGPAVTPPPLLELATDIQQEPMQVPPAATSRAGVWLGDHMAALRAGSGRY
jgi:surface antigen